MDIKDRINLKFLIISLFFVGTSIALMPINQVPDEMNHARISWEIVHKPEKDNFKWMEEIKTSPEKDKVQYKNEINKKINLSKEKFQLNFSLKSINHLPQLLGMMIMSLFTTKVFYIVMLGRIFNGLLYCVGCYLIARKLKFGKLAFMFISLLPIMIQQAGSLSYDVLNYLSIAYFFSLITNIIDKKDIDNKIFIQIILSSLLLYITKTNNLLLLAVLPFVETRYSFAPKNVERFIINMKELIKKNIRVVLPITIIVMTCVFFYIISLKTSPLYYVKVILNTLLNNNLNGHLNTILTIGMFGYIGNFFLQFPLWFIYLDIIVLFILLMYNPNKIIISKSFGILCSFVFPIQVLIIITGMYFMWTPLALGENANISVGAQGRYFTPFLIFYTPFLFALKDKISLNVNERWIYRIFYFSLMCNYVMMLFMVLTAYWINL